jgi:hypothetical protein
MGGEVVWRGSNRKAATDSTDFTEFLFWFFTLREIREIRGRLLFSKQQAARRRFYFRIYFRHSFW